MSASPVEYFRLRERCDRLEAALREIRDLGDALANEDFRGPEPWSRRHGRSIREIADRGLS